MKHTKSSFSTYIQKTVSLEYLYVIHYLKSFTVFWTKYNFCLNIYGRHSVHPTPSISTLGRWEEGGWASDQILKKGGALTESQFSEGVTDKEADNIFEGDGGGVWYPNAHYDLFITDS